MNTYWFKRGDSGFYWLPISWEGWTVTVFFLAIAILVVFGAAPGAGILRLLGLIAVPVLLWVAVVYMTGEPSHLQSDFTGNEDRPSFQ